MNTDFCGRFIEIEEADLENRKGELSSDISEAYRYKEEKLTVKPDKRLNWFQRMLWHIFFGAEIPDDLREDD